MKSIIINVLLWITQSFWQFINALGIITFCLYLIKYDLLKPLINKSFIISELEVEQTIYSINKMMWLVLVIVIVYRLGFTFFKRIEKYYLNHIR